MGHDILTLTSGKRFIWRPEQTKLLCDTVRLSGNPSWAQFYLKHAASGQKLKASVWEKFFTSEFLQNNLWGPLGLAELNQARFESAREIVNTKIRRKLGNVMASGCIEGEAQLEDAQEG
jgi:hypothetical protein